MNGRRGSSALEQLFIDIVWMDHERRLHALVDWRLHGRLLQEYVGQWTHFIYARRQLLIRVAWRVLFALASRTNRRLPDTLHARCGSVAMQ